MHDGERQRERDRQLLEQEPFEGYPNPWADPVFQEFLFGYDAETEVEAAWEGMKGVNGPPIRGTERRTECECKMGADVVMWDLRNNTDA